MPDYKFTGNYPRVMAGLIQGVNALVCGDNAPYHSTVLCLPGDTLHTDKAYEHAELTPLEDTPPDAVTVTPDQPDTTTDKENLE